MYSALCCAACNGLVYVAYIYLYKQHKDKLKFIIDGYRSRRSAAPLQLSSVAHQ